MGKKKMTSFKSLFNFKNKYIFVLIPVIVLAVFFFFVMLNNVHTETYDIERFNSAKETIHSPITIENEQETQRKTRETVQAVEDRYNISTEITEERVSYINEIFDAITKVEEENIKKDDSNEDNIAAPISSQEKVQQLKAILSTEIAEQLNDNVLAKLIEVPSGEREKGRALFNSALRDTLENGVRVENIQSAISSMKQNIKYSTMDNNLKESLTKLTEFAVVENSFFDYEKTNTAQKEAASNVEPVMIRAGEVLVRDGQIITNEIYEKLSLVGLLNKERNVFPIIGLSLLILLICSVITHEMFRLNRIGQLDKGKLMSILFISFIVVSLMKIISLYATVANQLYYVVPIATGVLLVKLLIHERTAILFAGIYAILGSVIFNSQIPGSLNVEVGVYFFFSQLAGIVFLINVKDRFAILKAGFGMMVVNIIAVLLFLFLSFEKYAIADIFFLSGFGIASAFLSAVLTIGLLPFFETSLGILSDIKLLQLSSPNQPLLKKLLTEAPGTYHHSVMVANLSETACEAVGANGLLARVGAYYHDIGKTVRAHYFIENQLSIKNPHDVLPPHQSAEIIIRHPYDGAQLLKKHRLPKEIIDIARQHHGTSLLKYFYHKEKETNKQVTEDSFRYPGPKPQTKEAAIICICDSVEAAVRSLKEPTEAKIEEIVASIVNSRLMDGQLDESPLTLKELKVIHRTICDTLKGIFHSRIQYPMKEAK